MKIEGDSGDGDLTEMLDRPRNQERGKKGNRKTQGKKQREAGEGAHVGEGTGGSRPGLGAISIGKGPQVTAAPPGHSASHGLPVLRDTEAPVPSALPGGAAVVGLEGDS